MIRYLIKEENGARLYANIGIDLKNNGYICSFTLVIPDDFSCEGLDTTIDNVPILFSTVQIPSIISLPNEMGGKSIRITELCGCNIYDSYSCKSYREDWNDYQGFKIKELILPDSLKAVGTEAFKGSDSFIKVVWPRSIETIPDNCFISSRIKEIVIPSGVTTIGYMAFAKSDITNITLPDTCKKIEPRAFYHCELLKNVNMPSGLQSIGDEAFRGAGIEEIIWPEMCPEVPFGCFNECKMLKKIKFSGVLKRLFRWTFIELPLLEEVDFSNIISVCEITTNISKDLENIKTVKPPIYGDIIIIDSM